MEVRTVDAFVDPELVFGNLIAPVVWSRLNTDLNLSLVNID